MKKKVLIIILVIILALVAFVVSLPKREKQEERTRLTPSSLEGPKIPKYVEGGRLIESTIEGVSFSFPEDLAVLRVSSGNPFGEDEAREFATRLGFADQPIVAEDVSEGTVYLWSGPEDNLVVYSKSRRIEYGLNQTPANVINKQLSNEAVIKISEGFIVKNFLSANEKVNFSFFAYLKSTGPPQGFYQSTREEASVYQANFAPISSEYKILTLDPHSSPVYVWVLPDGTVSKAIISKGLETSFSEEKYALKNYEEFSASLDKAVLVSLDDGNILLSVLSKRDVQKIVVNEVELVYLIDSSYSESYQPVFLLRGKARVKGYDSEVNALLYLPAFKNP